MSLSIEELPSEVADLARVVQGLLVHCAWLGLYAYDGTASGPISRTTLPVKERLASVLQRDGRELNKVRLPQHREVGTCRDFALMMCAFLRAKGTASRLRCGFASYFCDDWEDHWVCEYWSSREGRWCLSDAQLDDPMKAACGVSFDTADVPRDKFVTAGEAWLNCRAGHSNPRRFGQGDIKGSWFIKVNVVRDALALNGQETSSWDSWREAPSELRTVSDAELAALDRLARDPEGVFDLVPCWL
jgi:hypothetical protein